MALVGFLVRGGIVLFLVPIVVLPSPVGLANLFGPTLVEFVFGGPTLGLFIAMFAGVAAIVALVVGGASRRPRSKWS